MGERFKNGVNVRLSHLNKTTEFNIMPVTDIHMAKDISWEKVSDKSIRGFLAALPFILCDSPYQLYITVAHHIGSRRIEVGIRESCGCTEKQVARQFTIESVVLALISMAIGLVLVVFFFRISTSSRKRVFR